MIKKLFFFLLLSIVSVSCFSQQDTVTLPNGQKLIPKNPNNYPAAVYNDSLKVITHNAVVNGKRVNLQLSMGDIKNASVNAATSATAASIASKASTTDLGNLNLQLRSDLATKSALIDSIKSFVVGFHYAGFTPNSPISIDYSGMKNGWHAIHFSNTAYGVTYDANSQATLPVVSTFYDAATNSYSEAGFSTTTIRDNNIFMAKVENGSLTAWYKISPNSRLAVEVAALKTLMGQKADVSALSAESAARVAGDAAINASLLAKADTGSFLKIGGNFNTQLITAGRQTGVTQIGGGSTNNIGNATWRYHQVAIGIAVDSLYSGSGRFLKISNNTFAPSYWNPLTKSRQHESQLDGSGFSARQSGYQSFATKTVIEAGSTNGVLNPFSIFNYNNYNRLWAANLPFDGFGSLYPTDGTNWAVLTNTAQFDTLRNGRMQGFQVGYRDSLNDIRNGIFFLKNYNPTHDTLYLNRLGLGSIISIRDSNATYVKKNYASGMLAFVKIADDSRVKSKTLTLTTSSTPALDFDQGIQVTYVLTTVQNGDFFASSTVTNVRDGGIYRIRFVAPNTGVVYTFPSNVYKKDGTAMGAYAVTSETLIFHAEGTNLYCENK